MVVRRAMVVGGAGVVGGCLAVVATLTRAVVGVVALVARADVGAPAEARDATTAPAVVVVDATVVVVTAVVVTTDRRVEPPSSLFRTAAAAAPTAPMSSTATMASTDGRYHRRATKWAPRLVSTGPRVRIGCQGLVDPRLRAGLGHPHVVGLHHARCDVAHTDVLAL